MAIPTTTKKERDAVLPYRVLGIDPGSRFIGWAVVEDGRPTYLGTYDCQVRSRGYEALRCKVRMVLGRLLRDLKPHLAVVEEPTNEDTPQMRRLRIVLEEIEQLLRKAHVEYVLMSPKTARVLVCGDGWAEKAVVARVLSTRFPELRYHLTPRKFAQVNRYAWHSADALAVALAVAQEPGREWSNSS